MVPGHASRGYAGMARQGKMRVEVPEAPEVGAERS